MSEQDMRAGFDAQAPTEASAEAFKAIAAKYGVAPDAALAAHKIAPAPAVREPVAPVGRIDLSPTGQRDLTAAEQASGAAMLAKHWTGSQEDLAAALTKAGMVEVDDAADTRSENEIAFDGSALAPAATADDYHLSYVGRTAGIDVADVAAMDGEFRQAFAAASVPAALAQGLLDALLDGSAAYEALAEGLAPEGKTPPPGPKQLTYRNQQKYDLSQMGDSEQLMALASIPYQRMSKETQDMLHDYGALESAVAIRRLAQVGELIVAREGIDRALAKR